MNERYTFIDIYRKDLDLNKDTKVKVSQIIIPKIQRPYAQGRQDGVCTYVRNTLLNEMFANFKTDDIFDLTKNLRFCGADLFAKNLNFPPPNTIKTSKSRHLSTEKYKPIRIFVETTFFEHQSTLYPNLKHIVPIIKTALNKSVEGIKGLLEVKDNGEINYFKDVIMNLFNQNNITKWDPIFDNGADIKSDYLIIVKFDTEKKFPQGVLASAVPIYLEQETNRPLIGLLTITIEERYFYYMN